MPDKIAQMKKLMVDALLERQGRCFVHVVPSVGEEGAVLPSEYIERDSCTLALNMASQAPVVSDWGVEVATQFGGRPFSCSVPWSAVVQVFDPEQKAAVLAWLFPVQEGAADAGETPEVSEEKPDQGAGDEAQDAAKVGQRPSHLKVIK
ncbi:ClpXP protease specificity-enhancing factor SspB [Thiohalorhabdus sp.]|uniref:ClpXP protease specificity-enhancing factor SspB n=1 Tax=Thiohalorhabdus sp. TaxID=3094134 RepID=UPI002FC36065